jgi:dTDP-4-dehydrorhamnose 3,5-epimerase
MGKVVVEKTTLEGVFLITPTLFKDSRGFFSESYNKKDLGDAGIDNDFIQDCYSYNAIKGTVRGLHFQRDPMAQAKLVSVVRGKIFDVVLDLNKGSKTFGKWESFIIDDKSRQQVFLPKGMAHGFCTLEDETHVTYKVDQFYAPEHNHGIQYDDKEINIDWPAETAILSEADSKWGSFEEVKKIL